MPTQTDQDPHCPKCGFLMYYRPRKHPERIGCIVCDILYDADLKPLFYISGGYCPGSQVPPEHAKFKPGRKKTGGIRSITPDELWDRYEAYKKRIAKTRGAMTIQGIANAIGITRSTFVMKYKKKKLYHDVIEKIMSDLEDWATTYAFTGKATRSVIYYLNNFFGWKTESTLRTGNIPGETYSVTIKTEHKGDLKNLIGGTDDESDQDETEEE